MLKMLRYLKPMWWKVCITVVLLIAQAVMQLFLPRMMMQISSIALDELLTSEQKLAEIWKNGAIMAALAAGVLISAILIGMILHKVGADFGKKIRQDIFRKVNSLSVGDFNKFGAPTLITRTTTDVEQVQQLVTMGLRTCFFAPTMLIVSIIMIVVEQPMLALVLAFAIPLITLLVVTIFIVVNPLFAKLEQAIDNVTLVLRESLSGVRVIRAFNNELQERKRFSEANKKTTDLIIKAGRTMSFSSPIGSIIFNVAYISVFIVGCYLIDQGVLLTGQIGTIIASAQYANMVMMSFVFFSMILIMLPRANICAKRIDEVLKTDISIKDPKETKHATDLRGVVEFNDVTFTFPDATVPTLRHISFKTQPGTTTAIIGSTGSGKSSVINLIPRFYDVTFGQLKIDGVDVRDYSQNELRDKIGFVPQQAILFTGTIKENLLYGNKNASDEELAEAIKVAQAEHFISKKELGINSPVSQGGKNFSGGQKQRLSIARALVKKPEIYIFDDSFSALDFKTDIRLRTALKSYTKDSSTIIVAQRVSSIIDADNIIVLNKGEIVGQGKHASLLKDCEVYREIVYSQMDKDEIKKTLQLQKDARDEKEEN